MVRQAKDIDPNPRQLTPKQMAVLRFVRDFRAKTGYAPTMAEIAEHLGVSKVTVFEHVTVLEVKGWLKRTKHRARSLELAGDLPIPDENGNVKPVGLPLVGKIAAGVPIDAIEDLERIDINEYFSRKTPTYLLRVEGDSMIGDHICPGDLVVIEQRNHAHDGEIVVALTDESEATLKRLYRAPNHQYRLVASNPDYEDRFVHRDQLQVQGVLIGIVRAV